MRAWLYDQLTTSTDLQSDLGGVGGILTRVLPRRSKMEVAVENLPRPFLVFGLGNATNQGLVDDTANDPRDKDAQNQFFEVWVHDEGGSYVLIDSLVAKIIKLLRGASSKADGILVVNYLETSQEFNNETYNTNFRYIRFQAVMITGGN